MTMPTLIAKYRKHETVTRLKKAFAVVSEAVSLSKNDNGSLEYWDYTLPAKDFYNTYLKNYIKSTEEVPQQEINKRAKYVYMNGQPDRGGLANTRSYAAKLSDGTFIAIDGWYDTANPNSRNVIIDINGFAKPNKTGIDVFWFIINPKNILGTATTLLVTAEDGDTESITHKECSKRSAGYACSYKIISDGWEIKDDYPW